MKRKNILLLAVAVIAVAAWGVRVYYVNAGEALRYEVETFQLGEKIKMGKTIFVLQDVNYGENETENGIKTFPVTLKMSVQNTSDSPVNIGRIVESKLGYKLHYFQTIHGEFDINKLRDLPPDGTVDFSLTYNVKSRFKGKESKLYLPQSIYAEQVKKKFKEGKRYGIAIDLDKDA